MGNCCSPKEKPKQAKPLPSPSPRSLPTSDKSPKKQRELYIKSEGNPNLVIKYRSKSSIQEVWENILDTYSLINRETFGLYNGMLEITDFTATLQDLDIKPNKTLTLRFKEPEEIDESVMEEEVISRAPKESKKLAPHKIYSPSSSNRSLECIEEESTTRQDIISIMPKKAIGSRDDLNYKFGAQELGNAARLWLTAISGNDKIKGYIRPEVLDITMTSNTSHDFSVRDRKFPGIQAVYNPRNNGQSVLLDSDESFMVEDRKIIDRQAVPEQSHPKDFFQELQGPFYVLKQL